MFTTIKGFICESVLGCGGQLVLPPNYLKHAFSKVRAAGTSSKNNSFVI